MQQCFRQARAVDVLCHQVVVPFGVSVGEGTEQMGVVQIARDPGTTAEVRDEGRLLTKLVEQGDGHGVAALPIHGAVGLFGRVLRQRLGYLVARHECRIGTQVTHVSPPLHDPVQRRRRSIRRPVHKRWCAPGRRGPCGDHAARRWRIRLDPATDPACDQIDGEYPLAIGLSSPSRGSRVAHLECARRGRRFAEGMRPIRHRAGVEGQEGTAYSCRDAGLVAVDVQN